MGQDRVCENCGVELSSDLSNCPLCGKYLNKSLEKSKKNNRSYPLYDLKFVETARWYNIIRVFFWIIGIVCVIVNLMFKTQPYWFAYVLAALVMIFHVFISTIKESVKNYIKNLTIMSILVSIFLIFIDVYNNITLNATFGWSIAYVSPFVMSAGVIASTVICLSSRIYETELLRNISFIAFLSIIYFIVKIACFKDLATWPSLVFMCISVGLVIVLELFKRNKLVKELIKEFHL